MVHKVYVENIGSMPHRLLLPALPPRQAFRSGTAGKPTKNLHQENSRNSKPGLLAEIESDADAVSGTQNGAL